MYLSIVTFILFTMFIFYFGAPTLFTSPNFAFY